MSTSEQENLREYAKKRIRNQHEFRQLLAVWAFVSLLLTIIWFLASPDSFYWPVFAIGGIGIAVYFSGARPMARVSQG